MTPKLLRAVLLIWPSWLLVSYASMLIAFKIGDLFLETPDTIGGEIVFTTSCGALGGFFLWSILFGGKYAIGKMRSWYGRQSQAAPPNE